MGKGVIITGLSSHIHSEVINLGSMIKDKNRAFLQQTFWGFGGKTNKVTYKNQILNVKYGTGSVMILDAIKSQNI